MPVAAVSLRPLFPSQAPRIPIPRSPPPRCRVSRLTGIILHCVGKAVHVRGEPSGSWSSPCFHSLGTSCARKGMLFNKKKGMLFNTPRVSHFARNGQKQDEVFQHGELGTFHEEPWRCAHGERLSWAPPGVGAVPCLPPREQKPRCFSCWTLFLQRIRFIWEGRGGGEKPSPLCLLGKEPLADSSLGRLEGCAEASSRSAARGGWGPLPCSALWSPVRQC